MYWQSVHIAKTHAAMPRRPAVAHAELAENGVVLCPYRTELRDDSVETWSEKETVACGPCTPPTTRDTVSKKLARLSKYLAGLLTKKKIKKNYDDTKFVKSHVS